MRTRFSKAALSLALIAGCLPWLGAQETPRFTGVRPLTNREIALTLSVSNGVNYRLDSATQLPQWSPWVTLTATASSLQVTDSAAPFLSQRFYRAEQLSGTNIFTGDHLVTADGDVVFHPVGHASFVMQWNGKTIYNDPTNGAAAYVSFPRAD